MRILLYCRLQYCIVIVTVFKENTDLKKIYYYTEPLWFKLKHNYSDKCVKIETCSLVDPVGADHTRTLLLHTADLSHGLQQQILGKEKK
jgi:hypothetical protein